MHTRFAKGNQVRRGWRKPPEDPVPVVELPSAQDLATPHVEAAVGVLAKLLKHKSWMARRAAANDLIALAFPDVNEARVEKLVDAKLRALFDEAEARRKAKDADEKHEQRGIEVKS